MCHARGAVSNHIYISASACVPLPVQACAWLRMAGRPCTCLQCLCLQPAQRARGGGCMVCSENYFSTATRVDSCGALTISRHLADLVITHAGQTGLTGQTTIDRGRPPSAPTTVDSRHLSSCPKQQSVDTVVVRHGRVARETHERRDRRPLLGCESCSANPEARPSINQGQRRRPLANHDGKSHVFLDLLN